MRNWIGLLLFYCFYFNALGQKVLPGGPAFFSPCAHQSTEFILKVKGQSDSLLRVASQYGLQVVAHYAPAGILIVKGPIQAVRRLPGLVYVDCYHDKVALETTVPGHNLFVNRFNTVARTFPGIDGSGISVSIREERFDTTDVDLLGRIGPSPDASPFATIHAAQMATLVGGAGTSSTRARGGAPGCLLYTSATVAFLPNAPVQYARQGISVQNHSYGAAEKINRYDLSALAYDQSTLLRSALLHIFSAGNKGTEMAATGPYGRLNGFATLTGGFKTGKNNLVVGATDSLGRVWPFSSKGPTQDGRIKPDLVAFGQGGTSDASALTSGAAALVQQALWKQLDSLPSAALVRAVLLGSTDDIGAPGPDFESGFGRLNIRRALSMVQDRQYRQGEIAANARQNVVIQVPDGTASLTVTLAWNDPPAAAGATKILVNDLDLWLTDTNGRIYRPWVKPHAPDSVQISARPGRDTLNTAEQVHVSLPTAGQWRVWVGSAALTTTQAYALAFHQAPAATFRWTCPAQGDVLLAGKDALLYWESNLPTAEKGQIEWQVVGQSHWRTLSSSFSSDAAAFRWKLPDTFALARLRLRTGSLTFVSDTFLIVRELRLRVDLNCQDNLLLSWTPVAPPGTTYALYGLGRRYLERLFTTRDTVLILNKSVFKQQRFSVRALLTPNASLSGALAPAPDINLQGAGCYIRSFYATAINDRTAQLRLTLSTTYGVDRVEIERQIKDSWARIVSGIPALATEATDRQPLQGVNRYRAKVFLSSGRTLISDVETLYFPALSAQRALLFPVPLPASGGPLFWIPDDATTTSSATFTAFDMLGRKVAEVLLTADAIPYFFRLPPLPAGLYYYTIVQPNKPVLSGVWMMGQ
jgi:Subtilase family